MEITIKVDDGNLVKVQVGDKYRFVEGTERNMIISSQGEILKRYTKNRTTRERKDYYEYVHPKQNTTGGYLQINIPIRNITTLVHRLVAETFIDNPRGCREVDHINRDKFDNRVENLRWCTHEENMVNIPKCTERTYYRDITAVDLVTGKEYFFKKTSDIVSLAQERAWGKGWGYRLLKLLKQGGGNAYGFHWQAKTKEVIAL